MPRHKDLLRVSNQQTERTGWASHELANDAQPADNLLRALIDCMPVGVMVCDAEGTLVMANPVAMALFGDALVNGGGFSPGDRLTLHRPDGSPLPLQELPLARAVERGEVARDVEILVRRVQGTDAVILVGATPIFNEVGAVVCAVSVFLDITERKRAESEDKQMVEGMEDLLHVVSHDLRGPLALIRGHAQMIQRVADQADLVSNSAGVIATATSRMNMMIEDLVDSARFESGELKLQRTPVDLGSFVLDLRDRVATALETERIRVQIPEGLPLVSADVNRLERIFMNLVANALKYSDGEVTIRLSPGEREVIASVTDRGQGIPLAEQALVFRQFYRTKQTRENREGLGLGLYITKTLVEAHGGRIWVDSEEGKETTFSFTLEVEAAPQLSFR